MYLLYESLYGELLQECESTDIIGLYDSKEKAIAKAKYLINEDVRCNNYVLDSVSNDIEKDSFVRLFFNNQENWNDYYEIFIKKMDLE